MAQVAADASMRTTGLAWVAAEVTATQKEFTAMQKAEKTNATAAIAADKTRMYAVTDAAHDANSAIVVAAQKADKAVIKAVLDYTLAVDKAVEKNYDSQATGLPAGLSPASESRQSRSTPAPSSTASVRKNNPAPYTSPTAGSILPPFAREKPPEGGTPT